ncbi:MAG: 3-deoxy-D-manno-octulosonate 8-phosphate phosphatase (KDO 8-P phosphatase) [Crocinitomicaceae bacterium]|jgi:3-deoxy-D-manno-octulosonate 8-phosphate phosphatase (KDO 8-P phosphatase)
MNYLEENIKGICEKFGLDFLEFMQDMDADHSNELTLFDIEAIAEEYDTDVYSLLFNRNFRTKRLTEKLEKIKLLVLDVDGVMTDGGMYFAESGEQMKKFYTRDGMAIIHLTKSNFQIAIISAGFKGASVEARSEMLGIQHCYVGREPKIKILQGICNKLKFSLDEVAMIGDDINDLEVMRKVGVSFCPKDAENVVKQQVDVVLTKDGGRGCVRELIDQYILNQPLNK